MVSQALRNQSEKVVDRMGGRNAIMVEFAESSQALQALPKGADRQLFADAFAVMELGFARLADVGACDTIAGEPDGAAIYLAGAWGDLLCNLGLLWTTGIDAMSRESFSATPSYALVEMMSVAIQFDLRNEAASIASWIGALDEGGVAMATSAQEQLCWTLCTFMARAFTTKGLADISTLPTPYGSLLASNAAKGDVPNILAWRSEEALKGLRHDRPPFHSVSYCLVPIEVLALIKLATGDCAAQAPGLGVFSPGVRDEAMRLGGAGLTALRLLADKFNCFSPDSTPPES